MKKTYVKPDAEYISFEAQDIITDEGLLDGVAGGGVQSGVLDEED